MYPLGMTLREAKMEMVDFNIFSSFFTYFNIMIRVVFVKNP